MYELLNIYVESLKTLSFEQGTIALFEDRGRSSYLPNRFKQTKHLVTVLKVQTANTFSHYEGEGEIRKASTLITEQRKLLKYTIPLM